MPVEVGVGLGRGPDAEHQVVRVDRGDQAAVDPGLDAGDVVFGLVVKQFDLFFTEVRGAVHDFAGEHFRGKRQFAGNQDFGTDVVA